MNKQLTIFEVCSDAASMSLQKYRSDAKRQAIQRFLNNGKLDPSVCVNAYSPGRRTTKYFRLSFQWNGKKKHIHIKGGSTISDLARYRADQLQQLIDRGAALDEVLAMVNMFNGGEIIKPLK